MPAKRPPASRPPAKKAAATKKAVPAKRAATATPHRASATKKAPTKRATRAAGPPSRRALSLLGVAGVLGTVLVVGLWDTGDDGNTIGPNPGAVDAAGLTVPVSVAPAVEVAGTAPAITTSLSGTLRSGSWGDEVKAVQQRLHDLGFDPGPVDGQFGPGTEQAVWAFEALVAERQYREQTGKVTNELWQRMQQPLVFRPRRPGGPGSVHMEIYLPLQTAIVFRDDQAVLITHISSGELDEQGKPALWCELVTYNTDEYGQPLDEPVTRDECGYSKTPGGVFEFYRRYEGNRVGPLGGMWNPVYFNYGIAVHGARNVPREPASHGCIRVPMHIADYFPSLVDNGDRVWVWDGVKEPEQQSTDDMLPSFNFRNPDATTTTSSTSSTTTTVPATTVPPTTTSTVPAATTASGTTTSNSNG